MKKISEILEHKSVVSYILKRNLLSQYKKAKESLLHGDQKKVDFKKRRPYSYEHWYFRINKQFRALCYFEGTVLKVFKIDNHQD